MQNIGFNLFPINRSIEYSVQYIFGNDTGSSIFLLSRVTAIREEKSLFSLFVMAYNNK